MRRGVQRLKWIKHRRNNDGSLRIYLCKPGRKPVRLPNLPENHPDFLSAYAAALEQAPKAGLPRPASGTLASIAESIRMTPGWRELAASSREQKEREILRLLDKAGDVKVAAIEPRHIRADLIDLTPGAASNRMRGWRALMGHAIEIGAIDRDPSREVSVSRKPVAGHHSWTPDEIAAFRAHWEIGTDQRLAMELSYWTGARRSDVVRLGWQHVGRDGWLKFRQQKTGGDVEIPLRDLPLSCHSLADDHALVIDSLGIADGRMLFLETKNGAQRSDKAMSAWFRRACDAAGLPMRCTMHGLRKARAAALAELGWSEHKIGAWTGHTTLSEIVRYTRAANRKRIIAGPEQEQNTGTSPKPRSQKGGKT